MQVKRKGRNPIEVFELRINVPWREEIKRTTLSIAVHGEHKAFTMALDIIFECYSIKPRSELAQALQSCFSAYASEASNRTLEQALGGKQNGVIPFSKRSGEARPETTEAASEPETQMDDFSEVSAVKDLVFKKARHEFVNLTDGLFKGLKRFTA